MASAIDELIVGLHDREAQFPEIVRTRQLGPLVEAIVSQFICVHQG